MSTQAARRLPELDRAKGLAILLVVFGHLVAREGPRGVAWYEPLRSAVYLFHMPFFFYLSGYVAVVSGQTRAGLGRWPTLAARRAERLLLPFALFGLCIIAAKLLLAPWIAVDNVPVDAWSGLVALALDPLHSPAVSVWYLLVLFFYSVTTPLLLAADQGRMRLLILVAAALFLMPAPSALYLDRACQHAVFFAAGCIAAEAGPRWRHLLDTHRARALAALLITATAGTLTRYPGGHQWWLLACGLLSMPALHGLARSPLLGTSRVLLHLGQASFAIYLLNTVCIGLAKGLLLRFVAWDGAVFLPFAAVLMLAGTGVPVAVRSTLPQARAWLQAWRRPHPALDRPPAG